jgi:hypothetical protein
LKLHVAPTNGDRHFSEYDHKHGQYKCEVQDFKHAAIS